MQQQAKQDQARSASQWLSGEIDTLRRKVSDAEAKAAAFRARSNLFLGSNNTTLANQQLSELNTQLTTARGQKADAESRARLIRNILKSGRPIEASDVVDSELIRRLAEQRGTLMAQLAEQSSTLLGMHPRIKELKAQIGDLNAQIRQEAERRVRALENEARIADARVDDLTKGVNQLKGQAASSNELDVQMRALERDAKSQRDLLESYLAKFREATARDSISAAPADARVISRATVSNIPVFPKRIPTVLVATMLTLMLGVGFTVTSELLSPQNFRPIERDSRGFDGFARPAVAMPYRASGSARGIVDRRPALPVPMEVIEELARDLREAGEAGGRVTVFGATRGVGTSLAAITLARALNRDARVILIDLALAAPNLAAISTNPKAPGIVDLISGKATAAEVIMKDQLSAVHLIGAGKRTRKPADILDSPRLAVTLDALAQTYDHVVIDAGVVTDLSAERFAGLAPTGVLVVADPAHRNTEAARERLQAAGFSDVAVVVASS
jgi:Mrp family chromosome partitioning ATPase/capsule polysaccharide export protein KpsE/RkpR